MKRKVTKPEPLTYKQAEELMTELCTAEARCTKMEATIEAEQNAIWDVYQTDLLTLRDSIAEKRRLLEEFANENKDQWPKKAFALMSGTLSFRTTPHRLQFPDTQTEETILDIVEKHFPSFLTTTITLDRKNIIAGRDSKEVQKLLAKTGMTIEQDEKFSCKTKAA